jgi:hypothetical protein
VLFVIPKAKQGPWWCASATPLRSSVFCWCSQFPYLQSGGVFSIAGETRRRRMASSAGTTLQLISVQLGDCHVDSIVVGPTCQPHPFLSPPPSSARQGPALPLPLGPAVSFWLMQRGSHRGATSRASWAPAHQPSRQPVSLLRWRSRMLATHPAAPQKPGITVQEPAPSPNPRPL